MFLILEKKSSLKWLKGIFINHKDLSQVDITNNYIDQIFELSNLYNGALKVIGTRLEFLDDQFYSSKDHNPIHHMQSRIKTPESILEKIRRKNLEPTKDNIINEITDIAGIRVICNYIEDVYTIAEVIKNQEDFKVTDETDYIKNPKENGYRSYHLDVIVPVVTLEGRTEIPVEIQVRTIAMDMWASLEHEIMYKQSKKSKEIDKLKLKICADDLVRTDLYMQSIFKELE